uniref:Uncharacterized protein LOC100183481 n=1 Tax=Phallusia mammillata TaxID=59560 RepID=A0A6F9DHA9_9ASCI|nr:uncharacterized protein LOC100183481 [Phallusia mammillata]
MKSLTCNEKCLHHMACIKLEETAGIKLQEEHVYQLDNAKSGKDRKFSLFGSTLNSVPKCEHHNLHPPLIVHQICSYLRNHLTVVGLFRISGSHKRIIALKEKLENRSELTDENPHDVANTLTMFLRELSVCVFPKSFSKVTTQILNLKDTDIQLEATQLVCLMLPRAHLHCLLYICHFLWNVAENSSQNKMTSECLATVFAPNLLKFEQPKANTMKENLDCVLQHAQFVKMLINKHDRLGEFPAVLLHQSVCSGPECVHEIVVDDSKHKRRRSFADRMMNTVCGKLMKSHVNSSNNHQDASVYKEVRIKRTAEIDEEIRPAKRRSLQGSALSSTEVSTLPPNSKSVPKVPKILITPFQFQENIKSPNMNFADENTKCDSATQESFKKQQRHDSGSTSCFNATKLPVKPKNRRSLRNLMKHKHTEGLVVSYPVNDESSCLTGRKLANHSCESLSDLETQKKKNKKFLNKLKSPFVSPAVIRRSRKAKRAHNQKVNRSAVSLQPMKDHDGASKDLLKINRTDPKYISIETLESTISDTTTEDRTFDSEDGVLQSTQQSDASIFDGLDRSSEEVINNSVSIFDLSLGSLIAMNKPDKDVKHDDLSCTNSADLSSIIGDPAPHEEIHGSLATSIHDVAVQDNSSDSLNKITVDNSPSTESISCEPAATWEALPCNDLANKENEIHPLSYGDESPSTSKESYISIQGCMSPKSDSKISLHRESMQTDFTSALEELDKKQEITSSIMDDNSPKSPPGLVAAIMETQSELHHHDENMEVSGATEPSPNTCDTGAISHVCQEHSEPKSPLQVMHDCQFVLDSIINQITTNEHKPTERMRRRNVDSPLKRSRVISRRSGIFFLEESGIVRGKSPLRRSAKSPAKKNLRLVKRVNSPARPSRRPVMSSATKNKLLHSMRATESVLPNKLKLQPRSFEKIVGTGTSYDVFEELFNPVQLKDETKHDPKGRSSHQRIPRLDETYALRVRKFETKQEATTSTQHQAKVFNNRSIKPGWVSEKVEQFNTLISSKSVSPIKLAPLPYRVAEPQTPVSPYTLSKSLDHDKLSQVEDSRENVKSVTTTVPHIKSNNLDSTQRRGKTPVRTPPRPQRAPLVIMNVHAGDELDFSPIRKATPKHPRSRDPIQPF